MGSGVLAAIFSAGSCAGEALGADEAEAAKARETAPGVETGRPGEGDRDQRGGACRRPARRDRPQYLDPAEAFLGLEALRQPRGVCGIDARDNLDEAAPGEAACAGEPRAKLDNSVIGVGAPQEA